MKDGNAMDIIRRFNQAVANLSPRISSLLLNMNDEQKRRVCEIRLRAGKPLVLTCVGGAFFVFENSRTSGIYKENAVNLSAFELSECFKRICAYSVHTHAESIKSGYVTLEGGHRAGICGTAVVADGKINGVRDVYAINLRIAGEYKGSADLLYSNLFSEGLCSILLAGPPSSGKTTMLRDLSRQLSGEEHGRFYRTVIVDERGEIASSFRGEVQNDVGINCDVLSAYPKGEGILTALRCFSPEIIICDEVGSEQEAEAIETGINSGVRFAISAHASNADELKNRPQLRRLILSQAFDYAVLLGGAMPCRIAQILCVEDLANEIYGGADYSNGGSLLGEICGFNSYAAG